MIKLVLTHSPWVVHPIFLALEKSRFQVLSLLTISILLFFANPDPSFAQVPFPIVESSKYQVIGMIDGAVAKALDMGGEEIGSNNAPVPSNSDCGPTLVGNVPALAAGTLALATNTQNNGNVAITHVDGTYSLNNVGVNGNLGVHHADSSKSDADDGTSGAFFNDPGGFPNTHDGFGNCDDVVGTPDNSMEDPTFAGVTASVSFTALLAEFFDGTTGAKVIIPGLTQTATLDVSSASGIGTGAGKGEIKDTTHTITLAAGQNVIDVVTGGGVDFKITESTLIIDGPLGSFAFIRIPDDANMNLANSNILVGDGGIGVNNVVFFSKRTAGGNNFSLSNAILNGVAFWQLGMSGGEIVISNAQGCLQVVADKITLSGMRFNGCQFGRITEIGGTGIPVDTTALLLVGSQMTVAWLIPVIVSAIGIGIVITKKAPISNIS